jgi:hypothetical protein
MPPPPAAPSVANPRKRSSSASPQGPSARSEKLARTQTVPASLGEFVQRDVELLQRLGWTKFVKLRRGKGDFASLDNVHHKAQRLLKEYKYRGAPAKLSTPPWTRQRLNEAIKRGPHKSCMEYIDFLSEEFVEFIQKGQWIVLPASIGRELPGVRASPPGVIPQRGRRPRWIGDYTFYDVNKETLPLAAMEAMQFGHALDRILREILLANPSLGPVLMAKWDLKDGFYRVDLNIDDIPKLGLVFPSQPGEEPLMAFPLVLPMGWKNSPPIFSTATETIADLANQRIQSDGEPSPHHLDELSESVPPPSANALFGEQFKSKSIIPRPADTHTHSIVSQAALDHLLYTESRPNTHTIWDSTPLQRDPCLPSATTPLSYIDIFVDDFVGLAQAPARAPDNARRVRRILLHAIDDVFRPLEAGEENIRAEPVSLKKLKQGDCSWSTIKLVLGWIIDTTTMTIHLPPHRVERLWEILHSIPPDQKRTSVKKWYAILGELRSMSLALPGSRNMFSRLQNALTLKSGARVNLNKGVHQALDDFRWMARDITSRPTRIAELVPLSPSAEGHHDASGLGAGGVWFPGNNLVPREGYLPNIPVLWRYKWPQYIVEKLVTSENPEGTINNSDLELAGGILQLDCLAQTFDIRERTALSKGDNLATTFWERKGSTSTDSPPAYLLRLFGIHQRFHRYVPRFDYLSGPSNHIADAASRDFDLPWPELYSQLKPFFPQNVGYQLYHPSPQIVSAVISALLRKQSSRESLLVEPKPPTQYGNSGSSSPLKWASTPFSKPSRTKYQSYKSLDNEFVLENLQPTEIQSGLDRLKITYGTLPRRSSTWGPMTHD